MKLRNILLTIGKVVLSFSTVCSQALVHSHNDYHQGVPLYTAIASGARSIEIDVILYNGDVLVAHDLRELTSAKKIDEQYFIPISLINKTSDRSLKDVQLMIDIKNEPDRLMAALVKIIDNTTEFKKMLERGEIKPILISGSKPKSYNGWPDYILFDHQSLSNLDAVPLDKVGMFSFSFRYFSRWNGKGRLVQKDDLELRDIIQKVHDLGKPIRFWASPDSKSSWFTLQDLGVDFINTDKPFECVAYLDLLKKNTIPNNYITKKDIIPDYPRVKKKTENVILMIGDGAGLGHIAAAYYDQRGKLNITQSNASGYVITSSADDLITDSAAGATAFATGQRTNNRYIGLTPDGVKMENIFEKLPKEYIKVILTTDEVAGATPAAFYGHVADRDSIEKLMEQLAESNINLIIGGGRQHENLLKTNRNAPNIHIIKDISEYQPGKLNILLATEGGLPYKDKGRGEFLTEKVQEVFQLLEKLKKPYFLMVENSHTDVAGHSNSTTDIIAETLDFDNMVGYAANYIKNKPNTILLVLADHETGGITIPHGNKNSMHLSYSTDDHTAMPIPIFSWGINSELFKGFYPNYEVYHKILHVMGMQGENAEKKKGTGKK